MSATLETRSLAAARADAEALRARCGMFAERWEIAGSVRRGKREVGDVEHVVIPQMVRAPKPGSLFGEQVELNCLNDAVDTLLALGEIERAIYPDGKPRWGPKMRGLIWRGFRHEIFQADADNWGNQLAIRTGPADFSRYLVTNLRRQGLRHDGGYVVDSNGRRFSCADEVRFFQLCGAAWLEPEMRA